MVEKLRIQLTVNMSIILLRGCGLWAVCFGGGNIFWVVGDDENEPV